MCSTCTAVSHTTSAAIKRRMAGRLRFRLFTLFTLCEWRMANGQLRMVNDDSSGSVFALTIDHSPLTIHNFLRLAQPLAHLGFASKISWLLARLFATGHWQIDIGDMHDFAWSR